MRAQSQCRWVRRGVLTACLLSPLLMVASNVGAQVPAPEKAILADIEKAWEAREKRFTNADVRWTSHEFYVKGGLSNVFPDHGNKVQKIHPAEDTSFDMDVQFTVAGKKAHYGYTGKRYNLVEGRFNAIRYATTFDGELTKYCYLQRADAETWPYGGVNRKNSFPEANSAALRPILLFLRAASPDFFGVDVANGLTLANRSAKVGGVRCLEFQRRTAGGAYHLWIDPERDHVVVKQLLVEHKVPKLQFEIRYRHDTAWGWVPEGWDASQMDDGGRLYTSSKASVMHLAPIAPPPSERFDLRFPAGAMVSDQTDHTKHIVRADGSKRMIDRLERRLTYAELVRADNSARAGAGDWIKIGSLAAGLLCVCGLVWRRARRPASA